jgi:aspartokinase-like uncharacterized kinase
MLNEACLVEDIDDLRRQIAMPQRNLCVLDVERFLRASANVPGRMQLPFGWEVTSDSIAASVADATHAEELVLLKSTALPAALTRSAAAEAGFVDSFFPHASRNLGHIRWVDLRGRSPERCLPR